MGSRSFYFGLVYKHIYIGKAQMGRQYESGQLWPACGQKGKSSGDAARNKKRSEKEGTLPKHKHSHITATEERAVRTANKHGSVKAFDNDVWLVGAAIGLDGVRTAANNVTVGVLLIKSPCYVSLLSGFLSLSVIFFLFPGGCDFHYPCGSGFISQWLYQALGPCILYRIYYLRSNTIIDMCVHYVSGCGVASWLCEMR